MHGRITMHCDLKLENVMLTEGPDGAAPGMMLSLIDLGTVTQHGESHTGGTLEYIPPSDLATPPVLPSTDFYALGCMIFQVTIHTFPHIYLTNLFKQSSFTFKFHSDIGSWLLLLLISFGLSHSSHPRSWLA